MQKLRLNLTVKTLIIMGVAGILVISAIVGAGFLQVTGAIHGLGLPSEVRDPLMRRLAVNMLAVAVVMAFVGACFAYALSRFMAGPVVRLTTVAARVAKGDLTVAAPSYALNDELGDLTTTFGQLMQMLRSLIASLQEAARVVTATAESLAATTQQAGHATTDANQQMTAVLAGSRQEADSLTATGQALRQLQEAITQIAAGAQEQAEAVSEVTSLAAQVAAAGASVAQAAGAAGQAARQAREESVAGREAVNETIRGMEQLAETVRLSAASLEDLGRRSASVGEITALITDIAEQTNLLALNAAIEAARAGEHGRGFAVVADEVRKLAERSAAATRDIQQVLSDIQAEIARNIEEGKRSLELADTATRLSHQAGQALERIQEQSVAAYDHIRDAERRSQESAARGQQISQSAESVAAVVEENSAATEEMTASAESVSQTAASAAAQSGQNADAAARVTEQMGQVTQAVGQVTQASQKLLALARDLQQRIDQYRV